MNPRDISIDQYDYPLPDERIARHPLARRDSCKLLVYGHDGRQAPHTHVFSELPDLLPEGALLVYNDTRVINARMHFHKSTGAAIEIFCLEPAIPADYAQNFARTGTCTWKCLVGNSKRWKDGPLAMTLDMPAGGQCTLQAERVAPMGNAWEIRFSWSGGYTFADVIGQAGQIPIPPYLKRDTDASDAHDYQTVYSEADGSVAAPTAGLHFTDALLTSLDARGIERREVTLHVGAGTFQPVKSEQIGGHPMHSEFIAVGRDTISALRRAVGTRQVIAVGTTSVRTLESLYHIGCMIHQGTWDGEVPQWYPYEPCHPGLGTVEALDALLAHLDATGSRQLIASTRIIIAPGYTYRVVKGMITNFHQPKSTLLLLVSAFLGGDSWRGVYGYALDNGYRFLSYGDACLFL